MKKIIIKGGNPLAGDITLAGSKNIVMKAIVASALTSEEVVLENTPLISDVYTTLELFKAIGGEYELNGHTLKLRMNAVVGSEIPFELGGKNRSSSIFIAPLLLRTKEAIIPNPGGCRIGARPIDRHIDAISKMGTDIAYHSEDGYFHARTQGLKGIEYTFKKNTHTGTETLLMAAVLAEGKTIIHNAAEESEVDSLIEMLTSMGARIRRENKRTIVIEGVSSLHGTTFRIPSDSNEAITLAVASALTGGNVWIHDVDEKSITAFLESFQKAGGKWEKKDTSFRFYIPEALFAADVTTGPYPYFKTDWQGSWALLMTQANGTSILHETVYENRFGYVLELIKMGAHIEYFQPTVDNPGALYNFNFDPSHEYKQAIRIKGPTKLHNAILTMTDLRAGATLVLAALIANGKSIIYGVEHLERGYEELDNRLRKLGADIMLVEEQ